MQAAPDATQIVQRFTYIPTYQRGMEPDKARGRFLVLEWLRNAGVDVRGEPIPDTQLNILLRLYDSRSDTRWLDAKLFLKSVAVLKYKPVIRYVIDNYARMGPAAFDTLTKIMVKAVEFHNSAIIEELLPLLKSGQIYLYPVLEAALRYDDRQTLSAIAGLPAHLVSHEPIVLFLEGEVPEEQRRHLERLFPFQLRLRPLLLPR